MFQQTSIAPTQGMSLCYLQLESKSGSPTSTSDVIYMEGKNGQDFGTFDLFGNSRFGTSYGVQDLESRLLCRPCWIIAL